MSRTYSKSCDIHTTMSLIRCNVNFTKLQEVNVLIACDRGSYVLACVVPPERSCKVYVSGTDEVMQVDVLELFSLAQQSLCWSEF